jgi:hypothetical protein
MNAVQQLEVTLPTNPMISSRTKRIRPFAGGVINLAKNNASETAYLVRQGQQEVVEEDGGDRNYVILVVISLTHGRKNDENRCSPPLRIWKFRSPKVGKTAHEPEKRGLTDHGRGRQFVSLPRKT